MIKINDDWGLDSDRLQFILLKRSTVSKKDSENFGKEVWTNEAYLPKIEDVLRYLTTHEIKQNLEYGIEVIVEAVYEMQKIFDKLFEAEKQRILQSL
jgi:hypothetical protein